MRKLLIIISAFMVLHTSAQDAVAVAKEPLHKNVLENKYLRLLDLHLKPGDTTLFHKHESPCVTVTLQSARMGSMAIMDDRSPRVPSVDRRITFDGFYQSPRIHRVWNRDSVVYHGMDIEILTKGGENTEAPIVMEGITQVFDAPPVRAYRLILKGNEKMTLKRNGALLIIGINDGGDVQVNKKKVASQGDYLFVQPSGDITFSNKQDKEYTFAVLEMK